MLEKINWKGIGEMTKDVASNCAEVVKAETNMKLVMVLAMIGFFVFEDINMQISSHRRHKELMELEALRRSK